MLCLQLVLLIIPIFNSHLSPLYNSDPRDCWQETFKISVIVPIYNTEKYLEACILSVINQTVGFLQNIQLILVVDGATDNSHNIALKYQRLYPANVLFLSTENRGHSAARNLGISRALGTYIAFLDSDDIMENTFLEKLLKFMEAHEEVDVVCGRIKCFDKVSYYVITDYKFYKGTRVIDLEKEWDCVSVWCTACLIRRKAIDSQRFVPELISGEDLQFMASVLLLKKKLGVVREATYFYRSRPDNSSLSQSAPAPHHRFFTKPYYYYNYLFMRSFVLHGRLEKFVQFYISFSIRKVCTHKRPRDITNVEYEYYKDQILFTIKHIDEDVILHGRTLHEKDRLFLLSTVRDKDIRGDLEIRNNGFFFNDTCIMNRKYVNESISWKTTKIENNTLYLEGIETLGLDPNTYSIIITSSSSTFIPTRTPHPSSNYETVIGVSYPAHKLDLEIPLSSLPSENISFSIQFKESSLPLPSPLQSDQIEIIRQSITKEQQKNDL